MESHGEVDVRRNAKAGMCRTAEFKSVGMGSKPSFNGQKRADEDVSAEASMRQLLKSCAVGAAKRKHKSDLNESQDA